MRFTHSPPKGCTMTKRDATPAGVDFKALLLSDEGGFRAVLESALQAVLEAEMTDALQAEKGERTQGRLGYRSGYYERKLVTRVGVLELRVPQDRSGRFSTELFERYQRSEKALVAALAEMNVQGVSTRKVKAITEELCGHSFSASSISAINQRLDPSLGQFAARPLSEGFPIKKAATKINAITTQSFMMYAVGLSSIRVREAHGELT